MQMSFGKKLAELRKQRGWTQAEFGDRIGYHNRHVSRWERDVSKPSAKAIKAIAEALEVDVNDLLETRAVAPKVTGDRELLEKVRELQDLNRDDRAMVFRLITLLSTQHRMARMLESARHSSPELTSASTAN